MDSSGNITATNTFGIDGLASRHISGVSAYYLFDPQGNVTVLLDASNTVLGSYMFDAYGLRAGSNTTTDPYSYFGGQWGYYTDSETGLQLLTHRYYDPVTGRFVTRDPIGYSGGLNLYAYALENPIMGIDPSGFMLARPGWNQAVGEYNPGWGGGGLSDDDYVLGFALIETYMHPGVPYAGSGRLQGSSKELLEELESSPTIMIGRNLRMQRGYAMVVKPKKVVEGFVRPKAHIDNGNVKEGWQHINGRHITGTIQAKPGFRSDMFKSTTTRQQIENACKTVVQKGQRISVDPKKQLQTFVKRMRVNGVNMRMQVTVAKDGRVITAFPSEEN